MHFSEGLIVKQVAALPYRFDDDGELEVMLITSRGRRRWLPPKGHLIKGLLPHEAAAREALEEAGLLGRISVDPIGRYQTVKQHENGCTNRIDVTLYPLRVETRLEDWPERGQRTTLWFDRDGAAKVVQEPELARLITSFAPNRIVE